jgi:hypothetical protein
MNYWIPLLQTLCWIALIVWLVCHFNREVGAILASVQKRIDRGSSIKAGPFELGELEASPNKPNAAVPLPSTVAPPGRTSPSVVIPGVQYGSNPQQTFLLRSSWHGLKILKACKWAAQGNRLLKLREFADVGAPMTYDYAFGFLIAAFSADLVIVSSANPQSGHVIVVSVDPMVEARIDAFLEGFIVAHEVHSEALRADLAALSSYLKAR